MPDVSFVSRVIDRHGIDAKGRILDVHKDVDVLEAAETLYLSSCSVPNAG